MSEQLALFENPASEPEGLRYVADFVSAETEQKLISGIQDLPLQPFQFGQFQAKRQVASFGFRYDYALRQLQRPNRSPPGWMRSSRESKRLVAPLPGSDRSYALNATSEWASAGIATNLTSTEYLVFRWDPPVSFGCVEPIAGRGTGSHSMPNLARST